MLIIFNQSGSEFNVDFQYDSFSQGDSNTHIVDVIVEDTTFSNYEYNAYVQFLREGEKQPTDKLPMSPKRFERNGNYYNGYTYKMKSDWFTAIAGTLKMTIEIKRFSNGTMQSNKAYGVVNIPVQVSVSAQSEIETNISDEEYNAMIELINSKLNRDEYAIYDVGTFTHLKNVAHAVLDHKNRNEGKFVYIGKVEDTAMGFSKDVVAVAGYDNSHSSDSYRTIMMYDNQLVVYGGLDNEQIETITIPDILTQKVKVVNSIEVPTPTQDASAVNKKYLETNYDKKEDVVHTSGEKEEVITGEKTFTEPIKVDDGYGWRSSYGSGGFAIQVENNNGLLNGFDAEVDVDFVRLTISENLNTAEFHGDGVFHYDRALKKGYDLYYPKSSGTFATEEFVGQKVNELLDGAPEQYNTLKELADYVKSDETATSKILGDINKIKTDKADRSDLENIDYEEIKNKPTEAIFVVRDKVSDDTTQTAKEIEINGTKWAIGGTSGSGGDNEANLIASGEIEVFGLEYDIPFLKNDQLYLVLVDLYDQNEDAYLGKRNGVINTYEVDFLEGRVIIPYPDMSDNINFIDIYLANDNEISKGAISAVIHGFEDNISHLKYELYELPFSF